MLPQQYFEGPEKKVELVVRDQVGSLRGVPPSRWNGVVEAAGAAILSVISSSECDAYLLSESSLFVFDDQVTMITCGQTQLVEAVEALFDFISPDEVALLTYERKSENFPEYQPTSFAEDAARLAEHLPGQAFRFGDEHSHCVHVFHTEQAAVSSATNDTTLEVLMHGLDPARAALFGPPQSNANVAERTGLDRILPGFTIDEHLFEPTGYSLNALRDGFYYTIHVTPERVGSYCSFETNYDFRDDRQGIVERVVGFFRPESFDVLSFEPAGDAMRLPAAVPNYQLRKQVVEQVGGYDIGFSHFFRPQKGPARAIPVPIDSTALAIEPG